MRMIVVRKEDAEVKDLETHLVRIYADRQNYGDDCGVALIEVKGKHPRVRNDRSDMLYYVVEGTGIFHAGDGTYSVAKGDFLAVEKGTPYHMEGRFKALNISVPSYDPESDALLE